MDDGDDGGDRRARRDTDRRGSADGGCGSPGRRRRADGAPGRDHQRDRGEGPSARPDGGHVGHPAEAQRIVQVTWFDELTAVSDAPVKKVAR